MLQDFYPMAPGAMLFASQYAGGGVPVGHRSKLLFFVPSLFRAAVGSASLSGMHGSVTGSVHAKALLSSSAVFGIIIAGAVEISAPLFGAVLGLATGIMLYAVMQDSAPAEIMKNVRHFILGILLYAIAIECVAFFA